MDELKMLIDMVASLPHYVVWVLVGFMAYKLAVIGSIYGLARYVAGELFSWLKARKVEVKEVEVREMLDGMCIGGQASSVIAQLRRVCGKGLNIDSKYIHGESAAWLRDAIDAKEAADAIAAAAKRTAKA